MPKEIERKFLVDLTKLELPDSGSDIKQGYFPMAKDVKTVVRVRVKGENAFLTIKGENIGATRAEYEYSIPVADAVEMLEALCQKPFIDKTRYEIPVGMHTWELDIFRGENEGLVIAEVELASESEEFELPSWAGKDVTGEAKYYNSNLLHNPYAYW